MCYFNYAANFKLLTNYPQIDISETIEVTSVLKDRKVEVLQQIVLGKYNKLITKHLYISENPVKSHARITFSKYDVSGRVALIS